MQQSQIPVKPAEAEISEKNSRFLAILTPVASEDDIRHIIESLRQAHPKANHVVSASRLAGEIHPQEGFSDDGEPSGTSGMPVLKQLQHAGVVNALLCVVRYFGGTKLGTGGLQRAYSQSARAVLEMAGNSAGLAPYQPQYPARLMCSFQDQSAIRRQLALYNAQVISETFNTEGVILDIEAGKTDLMQIEECVLAEFHTAQIETD